MENLYEIPTVNFDAVLETEQNEKTKHFQKKEKVFDEKNYLNTRLDSKKNEKEKTIIVRILPNPKEPNNNPFIHVHTHNLQHLPKEISESGYKSYFCLSHYNDNTDKIDHEKYGSKCPFCEIRESAYQMSLKETDPIKKQELQKLSISNIPKECVIMRVIERGHEEDGPKFWKVNISRRADDPYSLILKLYNNLKAFGISTGQPENIFDTLNGRDLIVTISKSDNSDDKKTTITVTQAPNKSPISNDENEMRKWIFDEKQWTDVFAVKPYEYLSIISEGGIPWFDNKAGKWVSKTEFEKIKEEQKEQAQKEIKAQAEKINAEIEQSQKDLGKMFINEKELPF